MSDEELVESLRLWNRDDAADRIEQLINLNEALVELLDTARADAKEAEAYAEELEKELNICRMAQAVMDNTVAELEKERDDYAFKLADANNTYSEMHVALSEANDKLATCEKYRDAYSECDRIGTQAVRDLEAKLAKAVEALDDLLEAITAEDRFGDRSLTITGPTANLKWLLETEEEARATLAEIEGEKG